MTKIEWLLHKTNFFYRLDVPQIIIGVIMDWILAVRRLLLKFFIWKKNLKIENIYKVFRQTVNTACAYTYQCQDYNGLLCING